MAPSLRFLSDGAVHRGRQIGENAAHQLGVTAEQRLELIPSGRARYLDRASWALSYLNRAGAVERPVRGQYRITEAGRRLLSDHPDGIEEKDLRAMPGYVSPLVRTTVADTPQVDQPDAPSTDSSLAPTEQIEEGIGRLHATVAVDLLDRLHAQEPAFFEQAVLDLLMAMGYGGADGAATRTQLSNDGGIDGVIDQDALGLSRVHVQAKRYAPTSSVARPEIQAFVGALAGTQANQGVFITTGRFTQGARDYAASVPTRIVLIDGARLTSLMIKYGVGVQVKRTLHIVEVDEDFFNEQL